MINVRNLKNNTIFMLWVFLFLFLTALIWIVSQPLLKHNILRSVNSVLTAADDPRRIIEYEKKDTGKSNLLGYWYSMHNSTEKMFVFAIFQNGILVPLGAVVSANGSVNDIIPLSAHAVQVMDKLPASIMQIYIRRIEEASFAITEGNK